MTDTRLVSDISPNPTANPFFKNVLISRPDSNDVMRILLSTTASHNFFPQSSALKLASRTHTRITTAMIWLYYSRIRVEYSKSIDRVRLNSECLEYST